MADDGLRALPHLGPGDEYEHVLVPQRFLVLHQVVAKGVSLVRLAIGAVPEVPFELDSTDGDIRRYRFAQLDDDALKKALVKTGAAVATARTVAIVPGLEIRLLLRNDSHTPVNPRAGLMGQEAERP